jgi:hypothetical protein
MTLSTGGFRQVVAFPPAPIATGWSDPCREGLAPSQEPCLSTAHDFTTTTPELKFSVHTGPHASIPGEGCAGLARRRAGWTNSLPPNSRRATSRICSNLIYDRHSSRDLLDDAAFCRLRPIRELSG